MVASKPRVRWDSGVGGNQVGGNRVGGNRYAGRTCCGNTGFRRAECTRFREFGSRILALNGSVIGFVRVGVRVGSCRVLVRIVRQPLLFGGAEMEPAI